MTGLTREQGRTVAAIRRLTRGGVPPSYRELAAELGIASISGVHRLMVALEERGAIRRIPCRARAIEVIAEGEQVYAALPDLGPDALREVIARAIGLLAEREGVPQVAAMLHRLGDRLPRGRMQ